MALPVLYISALDAASDTGAPESGLAASWGKETLSGEKFRIAIDKRHSAAYTNHIKIF